jgi:hypothetical protein
LIEQNNSNTMKEGSQTSDLATTENVSIKKEDSFEMNMNVSNPFREDMAMTDVCFFLIKFFY